MIWASVMPDRILTVFLTSFWPTIGWTSSLLMRTFKEPEEDGMIWASVMPDRILTIFLSEPETVLVVTAIGMCLEPSKRRTCSQSLILYSTVLLSKVRTKVGSTRQVDGMRLPVILRATTSIGVYNLEAGKTDWV